MRRKLLIVFIVSYIVIFAIRAYGDYTSGGFPAFGLLNFLYWTFLYSLIPILPAYFIFQIISPATSQTRQKSTNLSASKLHPIVKVIITFLAIILGAWAGGYVGILFTSDRQELDALTGGLYGAPIGATIGLLTCWYYFYKRKV